MVARHDPKEVRDFLSIGVQLVDPVPVVPHYARICAGLCGQKEYRNIGQNDLWIAAVAMAHGKSLVSRNRRHFGLVEGLQVEALQD
jgi:predicted nucleic acid-binding protein